MQFAKPCGILSIILFVITATLYISVGNLNIISHVSFMLMSALTTICIWRTASFVEFKDEKKFWMLLAISMFIYFIDKFATAYSELVLNKVVVSPSVPDIFWIIGTIMAIYAFYSKLQITFLPIIAKRAILTIILGSLGVLVMLYPLINLILNQQVRIDIFIDFLYPILDIIPVVLSILIIIPIINLPKRISLPWILLGIGFICFLIYDFSFALYKLDAASTNGIIDLIYLLAYMLITLGGYYKLSFISKKND